MQFEETDEKNEIPAFVQEFLDTKLFKVYNCHLYNSSQTKKKKTLFLKNRLRINLDMTRLSCRVTLVQKSKLRERKKLHEKYTDNVNKHFRIRVIFSISDINNTVEEFADEEEEIPVKHHEGGLKEGEDEEKEEKEEEEEEEGSFPVRATVLVEKEGKGSLVLNTVAQDGYLHIDAVRFFKEGQIATDEIATKEIGEQRQDLYMGPVYEELDEDLQRTFIKYLEERGIDTALATFLPDYVDYKEQKEYVNWLKDVNDFVSA